MNFLIFSPFLVLALLANLAPAGRAWRIIALLVSAAINTTFLLAGLIAIVASFSNNPALEFAPGADSFSAGIVATITAIIAFLFMVPRVRTTLFPLFRWNLDPENTTHTIAVKMAMWAIGGSIASILLTRTVDTDTIAAGAVEVSLATLWEQAIIFVLLAVIGVGTGLRRGWTEARERLGLTGLSILQLALLPLMVIGLLVVQFTITYIWSLLDPVSLDRIGDLAGIAMPPEMMTLAGAFTIGFSAGIGEEILMRGALQPRFGLVFTTILFASLHTQYEISLASLIVVILSVVLGLIRQYFNTTAAILVHAGYNGMLVLLSIAVTSLLE